MPDTSIVAAFDFDGTISTTDSLRVFVRDTIGTPRFVAGAVLAATSTTFFGLGWAATMAVGAAVFWALSEILVGRLRAVLPGTAATTAKEPAAKPVQQAATAAPTGSASVPPVSAAPDALQMAAKVTDDMLPALSPKADIDVARTQLRLSALGIYKGPVDGFSGPQTRAALERWHALQQKAAARQPDAATRIAAPDSGQDAVAKVIRIAVPSARPQPQPATAVRDDAPRPKPELASYRKTESAAPAKQPAVADNVSPQDIVRVQAGLKAFGNDQVPVNGRQGKATEAAIRDFQRLFNMPVTGRIDATLIAKMREIGLIG